MMEESGGEDGSFVYGCPSVIKNETWNSYISAPFDPIARRASVQSITFPCIDETKTTDMTPPYGIIYESVTTDLGTVTTKHGARAYLLIPGIVLHLSSKAKNWSQPTLWKHV